jgi:hypothetical protein
LAACTPHRLAKDACVWNSVLHGGAAIPGPQTAVENESWLSGMVGAGSTHSLAGT